MLFPFSMKAILILLAISTGVFAQNPEKIKFRKEGQLYFFKKGSADTIIKNSSDVFYLVVPDSLKPWISIRIDNARLTETRNDSLVKVQYTPGMKYEALYTAQEISSDANPGAGKLRFRCMVNGASQVPGEKIKIELRDLKEDGPLLINEFFYREK